MQETQTTKREKELIENTRRLTNRIRNSLPVLGMVAQDHSEVGVITMEFVMKLEEAVIRAETIVDILENEHS